MSSNKINEIRRKIDVIKKLYFKPPDCVRIPSSLSPPPPRISWPTQNNSPEPPLIKCLVNICSIFQNYLIYKHAHMDLSFLIQYNLVYYLNFNTVTNFAEPSRRACWSWRLWDKTTYLIGPFYYFVVYARL